MYGSNRPILRLERLNDRIVPAGGCAVGGGVGMAPMVRLYNETQGTEMSFLAYDANFRGGVRVATGDITGDGVEDVVTAAGTGGGPHIKVFDGVTGQLTRSFLAYDPAFRGGNWVAIGDVNGDGRADIITGAGEGGGPHIKAFSGVDNSQIKSFFAYDAAFRGGATVATGDISGDGIADIVTGAGFGGGPHVKAFDSVSGQAVLSFFAYEPEFRGGVFVAAGRMQAGDLRASIITGPGTGGGPFVKVFDATGALTQSILAYDQRFRGGVRVSASEFPGLGTQCIVTAPGEGGGPQILGLNPANREMLYRFYAFDLVYYGGVFVG